MAINKSVRDTIVLFAVIGAFVILVMANLLADRKFVRYDLTKEGRYSLSAPFQHILSRIQDKDTAKVTYYVSTQIPSWFVTRKRDILDKLNEIKIASGGRIEIEVVDPAENRELRDRLAQAGAEFQVPDVNKDSTTILKVFTALEVTYRDKPRVLVPGVGDAEDLEYQLGSKIVELTLDKKPIVAIQAPAGPPPQMQMQMGNQEGTGFEWLQQGQWGEEAKKFDVRSVDLSEHNPFPADTALLIMIRPKELNARQRYEVVKYLAGGGKLLLLASPFKVAHEFGWRVEHTPTGLEDYLKEVGVAYGADFVCDNANLRVPISINPFTGEIKYSKSPFFIQILGKNIDQDSPLTRLMPGLLMPSPAEIRLNEGQLKKLELKATVLAKTSAQSWTVPYSEIVNPDLEADYDETTKLYTGSKNVFVMLGGQFPFPYEGKPVPEWPQGPEAKPEDKEKDKEKKPELASVVKKPGTLLLCSAPEAFHIMYLKDQNLGRFMRANADLIVNIAESVSLGDDLIKLRTKRYEARTINRLTGSENDRKRNLIKFALIGGVPLLVVLFALLRAGWRRATQTRYERKFAQTTGPSSFTP